ncbi:unnamed protein product [Caenorhabditis auriculariae]|uniref:Tc1-like transposase DDE domain-containing protein n=1 Tax=Caenorhabditis auriculariae TaxID=2777116 RepID=A0A8S1H402_9PELO|nr:unnamed protein product [Caenorhabditis auriculariae]
MTVLQRYAFVLRWSLLNYLEKYRLKILMLLSWIAAIGIVIYFEFWDMGRTFGNKNLTDNDKRAIVVGRQNGLTMMTLAGMFGVTEAGISQFLKRQKAQDGSTNSQRTGRPRVTDRNDDRNILKTSRTNPRLIAPAIRREVFLNSPSPPSVSTVKRRLNAAGIMGRRPVKKPLISEKNRAGRVKWAKEHLNWTRQDWNKILWSDESKFLLFGSDGIQWVRRPIGSRYHPKYQLPTVKHGGGSCMVWGAFSGSGIGPLHRVNGIMDKHVYKDILQNQMLPHLRAMGRGSVYQQDNDPKHTSLFVKDWFKSRRVNVMGWPSQSPDLNPIEHLWEELERRCANKRAKNCNEKFAQLLSEWNQIPMSTIDTLLNSMQRRCQAATFVAEECLPSICVFFFGILFWHVNHSKELSPQLKLKEKLLIFQLAPVALAKSLHAFQQLLYTAFCSYYFLDDVEVRIAYNASFVFLIYSIPLFFIVDHSNFVMKQFFPPDHIRFIRNINISVIA